MENEKDENTSSISDYIENDPLLKENLHLKDKIINLFDFTQYLLDDDENLTKTGNLTSSAKKKLDQRIDEVFEIDIPEE